jgi:CheY-like chemotaxis protein
MISTRVNEDNAAMSDSIAGGSTGQILLLDDEYTILETSKMMLELLGFTVTGTSTPSQALDALRDSSSYDLIMTDLEMPEMDGREFANAARTIAANIPVVVVSGYVLDEDEWRTDFDGMLMKPFRVEDLKDKVDEFLAKRDS